MLLQGLSPGSCKGSFGLKIHLAIQMFQNPHFNITKKKKKAAAKCSIIFFIVSLQLEHLIYAGIYQYNQNI